MAWCFVLRSRRAIPRRDARAHVAWASRPCQTRLVLKQRPCTRWGRSQIHWAAVRCLGHGWVRPHTFPQLREYVHSRRLALLVAVGVSESGQTHQPLGENALRRAYWHTTPRNSPDMSASNGYSENPRSGWRPWLRRPSPPAEDRLIVGLEERRATAGDLRGGEHARGYPCRSRKFAPRYHRAQSPLHHFFPNIGAFSFRSGLDPISFSADQWHLVP